MVKISGKDWTMVALIRCVLAAANRWAPAAAASESVSRREGACASARRTASVGKPTDVKLSCSSGGMSTYCAVFPSKQEKLPMAYARRIEYVRMQARTLSAYAHINTDTNQPPHQITQDPCPNRATVGLCQIEQAPIIGWKIANYNTNCGVVDKSCMVPLICKTMRLLVG